MTGCVSTVKRVLCTIITNYYFILGYTAYHQDIVVLRTYTTVWRRWYANCINTFVILGMPWGFIVANQLLERMGRLNDVLGDLDTVNVNATIATSVLFILTRSRRDGLFNKMLLDFGKLQRNYFDKQCQRTIADHRHREIEERYDRLLSWKIISILSQLCLPVFMMGYVDEEYSWFTTLTAVFYGNVMFIVHSVLFFFFIAMCCASKYYEILNENLLQLRRNQGRRHRRIAPKDAVEELSQIGRMHSKVTRILQQFNSALFFQFIPTFLTYVMNYVMWGYYAILVLNGPLAMPVGPVERIVWLSLCMLPLLDFFLFCRMCEMASIASRSTSEIMRTYATLPYVHKDLERQCEIFALQLDRELLHLNIGGMCGLRMRTFISMGGYILQHIIIVVQYDYSNRYQEAVMTTQ